MTGFYTVLGGKMLLKRKLCLDKMGINIKQTMPNGQQRSLEVVVASNTGGIGENWIRAYTRAVEIAGRNGCVLSMPKLVQAKIDNPNNGELWGKAINANSEEVVGIDKEGRYSQKNSWVFVEFHGTGLLNPEKLKYAYFHRNAISDADFQSLLAGKLPDGSQVPMYRADQFVRGIQNTSQRYGVVFPIEEITKLGPDLSRHAALMFWPMSHSS